MSDEKYDKSKWIETVRKLLANSVDDALDEKTREHYANKASELIVKYGIEEAMLASRNELAEGIVDRHIVVQGTFAAELHYMLSAATQAMGLFSYHRKMKPTLIQCHFVGHESDVARLELLLTSLLLQQKSAMQKWWPTRKDTLRLSYGVAPTATESYKERRAFIIGFAGVVADRLEAQRQKIEQDANTSVPGTELVLVNRAAKVDQWVGDNLELRNVRTRGKQYRNGGLNGGAGAGAQANLGGTGVGNSSGKAIG